MFRNWLLSLLFHWQGSVSGGGIGGLIIIILAIIERTTRFKLERVWYLAILFVALVIGAAYASWLDARRDLRAANSDILALKADINEMSSPLFSVMPFRSLLGSWPDGSSVGLFLKLINKGAPSEVLADSWSLHIRTQDGREYDGLPISFGNEVRHFCLEPGSSVAVAKSDSLYVKASKEPIHKDGYLEGFLWFKVLGLDHISLKQGETVLTVSAISANGTSFSNSFSVNDFVKMSQSGPRFDPTLGDHDVNTPCN